MSESNIIFRVQENQPEEIIRISSDGNIYWRGRLIEADQDFKDAMLDLRDAIMRMQNSNGQSLDQALES